ncbi:MAG: hypothetical protein M3O22_01865 [Pseudomonadota bacterium]|nr:hypothetical protein [Pseudomonadota bacterium]
MFDQKTIDEITQWATARRANRNVNFWLWLAGLGICGFGSWHGSRYSLGTERQEFITITGKEVYGDAVGQPRFMVWGQQPGGRPELYEVGSSWPRRHFGQAEVFRNLEEDQICAVRVHWQRMSLPSPYALGGNYPNILHVESCFPPPEPKP